MRIMIEIFILSVKCFALSVMIHWFLLRFFSNRFFVAIAYIALVIGIILSEFIFFSSFAWVQQLVAGFLLVMLWNLYVTFLINLMNSISISIIVRVIYADKKVLSLPDLVMEDATNNQLESRLSMAQRVKLIRIDSDTVEVLMLGRTLNFFISGLRKIWGISIYG